MMNLMLTSSHCNASTVKAARVLCKGWIYFFPGLGKGQGRFCWNFEAFPTYFLRYIVLMLLLACGTRSEGCHELCKELGIGALVLG